MSTITTDIDIDFADRLKALAGLTHVPAMRNEHGRKIRHPSGVYFQAVPVDPFTNLCAFDFNEAAELGYFKIDFLNNSLYEGVRDEDHLDELLNREPPWEAFEDVDFVQELAHIRDHFGIVKSIRPKNIEDLAVVLALIRPGKKHLRFQPREVIDREIWEPGTDGYTFKRAHAIAFAASIVVQLNLMIERLSSEVEADQGETPFDL